MPIFQKILVTMFTVIFLSNPVFAASLSIGNGSTNIKITHGVAIGDVRAHSAVIWSRSNKSAEMHVRLKDHSHDSVDVTAESDYTGKIMLKDLKADTKYKYKVWFGKNNKASKNAISGTFHTAPHKNDNEEIHFAWGGDVAGQNVCRDVNEGFPVFNALNDENLDFFIGLGDMIYADGTCSSTGRYGNEQIAGDFLQAATMKDYWAHWKYTREDDGLRKLLGSVPYYAIWDDHEVVNDFGPLHDTRNNPPYTPGEHLLPKGLNANLHYNPVAEHPNTPKRLYRSIRWGKNLEMFILDERQYRDANLTADNEDRPKTMLGREQLTWLKQSLQASDATWKIIISSVPLSIPTGFPPEFGRDGWGNFDQTTGFEKEIIDILAFMKDKGMYNVAFITTDVHFAEVFKYTPFANSPDFNVYEFVTGPLNAGLFPNRDFDDTLNPESLFFYGPESFDSVKTYEQAKPWFNYGDMVIDENGVLHASVKDVNGKTVFQISLPPHE